MRSAKKISTGLTAGMLLTACLMAFCLTLLTTMNFFLYPADKDVVTIKIFPSGGEDAEQDYPPTGPTEEKSSTNSGFSFAEEILHESHPEVNAVLSNHLYLHHIAEAEKIQMFHPELILPPPKLFSTLKS